MVQNLTDTPIQILAFQQVDNAIQWMSVNKTNYDLHWIETCLVDFVIHIMRSFFFQLGWITQTLFFTNRKQLQWPTNSVRSRSCSTTISICFLQVDLRWSSSTWWEQQNPERVLSPDIQVTSFVKMFHIQKPINSISSVDYFCFDQFSLKSVIFLPFCSTCTLSKRRISVYWRLARWRLRVKTGGGKRHDRNCNSGICGIKILRRDQDWV